MAIHIANYQPERTGGGWTQARYLYEGLGATDYDSADTYLITGPTMVSHDEVNKAKQDGKKIVLRVDNAVRNSRNRGSGMTRLKAFSELADVIIYQSHWAKSFLHPFLKKDGPVILNACDLDKYRDDNRNAPDDSYLYVRSSRDEGKQWIMAWYWFVNNPGKLEIVGKFSPENLQYNFDFYNNERFTFMGEQADMADVYRRNKYFLYTYLNDACSNTAIEALCSGCQIKDVYGMCKTGGMPEILNYFKGYGRWYFGLDRMMQEYGEVLSQS